VAHINSAGLLETQFVTAKVSETAHTIIGIKCRYSVARNLRTPPIAARQ